MSVKLTTAICTYIGQQSMPFVSIAMSTIAISVKLPQITSNSIRYGSQKKCPL